MRSLIYFQIFVSSQEVFTTYNVVGRRGRGIERALVPTKFVPALLRISLLESKTFITVIMGC